MPWIIIYSQFHEMICFNGCGVIEQRGVNVKRVVSDVTDLWDSVCKVFFSDMTTQSYMQQPVIYVVLDRLSKNVQSNMLTDLKSSIFLILVALA